MAKSTCRIGGGVPVAQILMVMALIGSMTVGLNLLDYLISPPSMEAIYPMVMSQLMIVYRGIRAHHNVIPLLKRVIYST
jgi:hypothetical protein